MYIYLSYFVIVIEESRSLKDKRKVLKSIIDSIKIKFKISISEVKYQNDLRKAGIAVTSVSSDNKILYNLNRKIEDFITSNYPGRLLNFNYTIEQFEEDSF